MTAYNTLLKNKIYLRIRNLFFKGSKKYWETRYANSGNSGNGSYGENAEYKAKIINDFYQKNDLESVIEWGCGDGNQLIYLDFKKYIGIDVSQTIIKKCQEQFANDTTKQFFVADDDNLRKEKVFFKADLVLSLDVIYHLVEDRIFENYMHNLFSSSKQYVIIYAWDTASEKRYHVRHRKFSKWISENQIDFKLIDHINATDKFCDFFIYKKIEAELP